MVKFLCGLAVGLICSQMIGPLQSRGTVLAQVKGKETTAKIVSDGVLLGWSDVMYLTHDDKPIGAFLCREPQASMKYKSVVCSTEGPAIARGPILTGAGGALPGWQIGVSGEQSFECKEPIVDFAGSTLLCPAQTDFARLQVLLSQSQADLADMKEEISHPAPWTINIAGAPPHGFACPAGTVEIEDRILTCPAIVPIF